MNLNLICNSMSVGGAGIVRITFEAAIQISSAVGREPGASATATSSQSVNLTLVVPSAQSKDFTVGEKYSMTLSPATS